MTVTAPVEPTDPRAQMTALESFLSAHQYRYRNEAELQDAIAAALAEGEIEAQDEASLTPHDRIDFLVGRVGIEVKVAGTPASVTRQLRRYALSPDVDGLILVTNRARHRSVPRELNGKPVRVVWLSGLSA